MKVIDHILKTSEPTFSCEVVPSFLDKSEKILFETIQTLKLEDPKWINVMTYSSRTLYRNKTENSEEKIIGKNHLYALEICGAIQNRLKIDAVAHILCRGYTREETKDALIKLHGIGINNILALRGDGLDDESSNTEVQHINHYAADLVKQVHDFKMERSTNKNSNPQTLDFCIGVAGYPEKHFEASSLDQDIHYLKQKIQSGAEYVVTQMFFNNEKYFSFVQSCRSAGIKVPIVPGIKLVKSYDQAKKLSKNFHFSLPPNLAEELFANQSHASEIGLNWTVKQCEELLQKGVPGLHFYVMNDAPQIVKIVKKLRG
jgi:methylenetetrahydrofolate reductase (NADPH)